MTAAILAFLTIVVLAALIAFVAVVKANDDNEAKENNYKRKINVQAEIITYYESVIDELNQSLELKKIEIAALTSEPCETDETETDETETETVRLDGLLLPDEDTNMYVAMDYRKITNKRSEQYILQQHCTTAEYGIRRYGNYYTVAMGSYYSHRIGDTFTVELVNGTAFNVMVGEFKDDGTDTTFKGHSCTNYDGEPCINIIEFIVDMDEVDRKAVEAGTLSAHTVFGGLYGDGGNIKKITYTGTFRDWSGV